MNSRLPSRFSVRKADIYFKYNTLNLKLYPSWEEDLSEEIPSPDMKIECFRIETNFVTENEYASFSKDFPNYESEAETIQFLSLVQKICNKFDSIKRLEIDGDNGCIPLVALSTILIKAKRLEEISFVDVDFVTGNTKLFLESMQQISNKSVKRCYLQTAWVNAFDNNSNNCLPTANFGAYLLAACHKLEYLKVQDDHNDWDDYKKLTNWNGIFTKEHHHLKKLEMHVGTSCPAFFAALSNLQPSSSLRDVEIMLMPDKYSTEEADLDALEEFLSRKQPDNHPVTKLGITAFGFHKGCDLSVIAKALRYNRKLTTFRFIASSEDSRFFDDGYAKALAASILENPKLTCVESTYQNEDSDHVKNIEMYLAVNRHKGMVLEEGHTAATKLLWVHMLGVYGENLSYLYHVLQQNPSLCNLNNQNHT